MHWLNTYGYVAAWLQTLIGATGLVIQNTRAPKTEANWPVAMVYITYLTCLAVVVSPDPNPFARGMAIVIVGTGFFRFLQEGFRG